MKYLIREVKVDDAEKLIEYVNKVSGESDNLTFGIGEFEMTVEKEVEFIESLIDDDNAIMLLAMDGNEIIGQVHYSGGKRKRLKHVGEFGITVRKDYWGQGIGRMLLEEMIKWAKASPYCEKINLRVRDDNLKAIALYRKLGFKVEGLLKRDMKINGEFTDCLFMGMEIGKQ